jgi:peptide chain release factor 2
MRHTSFALVEVLPEINEDDVNAEIKEEDLKIDVFRSGGSGGQSVNTTDSAVRITHLPTGLVVKCQNERSQLQNRNMALKILKARLVQVRQETAEKNLEDIKGEYRRAEWGNQARSYVLAPYRLVKDHRTDYETSDTDRVLDGEIDDFIEKFLRLKATK